MQRLWRGLGKFFEALGSGLLIWVFLIAALSLSAWVSDTVQAGLGLSDAQMRLLLAALVLIGGWRLVYVLGTKRCAWCQERVRRRAVKCRHCHERLQ